MKNINDLVKVIDIDDDGRESWFEGKIVGKKDGMYKIKVQVSSSRSKEYVDTVVNRPLHTKFAEIETI